MIYFSLGPVFYIWIEEILQKYLSVYFPPVTIA